MKKWMNRLDIILFIFMVISFFSSMNVYAAEYTCSGIFSNGLMDDINKYVFVPIKYLTPIALLVLTSIDVAGIVFSGKKEGVDKAKNNFLKRLVAALIIFFAPDLIKVVANLVDQRSIASCMEKFGTK